MAVFSDDPNDLFDTWVNYQKYLHNIEETGKEGEWEQAVRKVISEYLKMAADSKERGKLAVALDHYHKACTLGERLCKKTEAAKDYERLSICYYWSGEVYKWAYDPDNAYPLFEKAAELGEMLRAMGGVESTCRFLIHCYCQMGDVSEETGGYHWAKECYKKGLAICEELYEKQETRISCEDLALFCQRLGTVDKDKPDEEYLRRALAIYHRLLEIDPENKQATREIPVVEELLGKRQ